MAALPPEVLVIYLRRTLLPRLYRSTLHRSESEEAHRAGRPCDDGIRELSSSDVHSTTVASRLVGSYPTFSPLPPMAQSPPLGRARSSRGGYFLLHSLAIADYWPLTSGMPYAARTFLTHHKRM